MLAGTQMTESNNIKLASRQARTIVWTSACPSLHSENEIALMKLVEKALEMKISSERISKTLFGTNKSNFSDKIRQLNRLQSIRLVK